MSSKHHHRSSQHDTKSMKFWRSFLAFMLFLTLTATSLFACARITYVSPQAIVNMFCSKSYVTALQNDITAYTKDLCMSYSVAEDGTEALTYDAVYDMENAYIAGLMGTEEEYTETSYMDFVSALAKKVSEKTVEANSANDITADADVTDGEARFTESLENYMLSRVEFPLSDQLKTVVNLGSAASLVGSIAGAAISVLLGAIVVSIGHKRYRAMRELVYAATAASMTDLALIGGVKLVGLFKSLVIYPSYLADAVMWHVNRSLITTALAAAVLFAVALSITVVIWTIKRRNNT